MKILQTNNSKFFAIIIIIMLGLSSLAIFAQEKDETKSKLDNVKGKIEKLTIKADGKDIVFEGKDAEKLVGTLKGSTHKEIMIKGMDGKIMKMHGGNVVMFSSKEDADEKEGENKKNIKVEANDNGKKVTVTTMKDGKEETKIYEGEDAEKFLKEENGMKHFNIKIDNDEDMQKGNVMFYKQMDGNSCGCCCCGGNKMMMRSHSSGKGMKHMIIEEKEDDETSDKVEKKVEKKTK